MCVCGCYLTVDHAFVLLAYIASSICLPLLTKSNYHHLPHTISSDVREGVQIKLPPPYQPLQYACRSRGNGGQGTAVVIRRDVKSLLTLELHCNIGLLDMTLHSCKSSHIVLYLHVYYNISDSSNLLASGALPTNSEFINS